jgi:hypothetical protein
MFSSETINTEFTISEVDESEYNDSVIEDSIVDSIIEDSIVEDSIVYADSITNMVNLVFFMNNVHKNIKKYRRIIYLRICLIL